MVGDNETCNCCFRPCNPTEQGSVIEEFYRRRHIRYPLRVPVEFQMPSKDDRCEAVEGEKQGHQ